jgi:putative peptidoglycan lipid II flippase
MNQDVVKPHATTRSAAILTVLSILSPLSGLVMEMVLAWCYGASDTVDAFRIASLVMGMGNQIFFGYLVPHVVIPLFSEYRAKGFEYQGWRLAFTIALILSLTSLFFVSWVWSDPEMPVKLLGPGLTAQGLADAALLIRYFSFAFLLIAWSGVISGILHVYRVFWLSAVAQILPNCFVILSVLIVGREWGMAALALGSLLGYAAILSVFVYALYRKGRQIGVSLSACLRPGPRDGLQKALFLALPLIATLIISQWGIIVSNRVLSEMPPGTLAEFGYAWKLLALVGLLPAGLAIVVFPAFADAHANGISTQLSRLVTRSVCMTLFLTIPLAAVLFVERLPIVSLLFGRGGMSMAAMADIGKIFGILLVGAPAGALGTTLSKVAFSMQDTKLPAVSALITALSITIFVPYAAGAGEGIGVAWALSAIAWASTLVMLGYQIARYRIMSAAAILRYVAVLMVLSIGIVLPVAALRTLFELNMLMTLSSVLIEMTFAGLVFIVTGYILSRLLGIDEASEIAHYIIWQLRQIPFFNKSVSR